ncbi:hypothetical protein F441_21399 [Phytophthora nicotianae CJ01A1]|uniref:Uncharacterized protein n=6 Tax=Phytophthora nicotianae TaxID=4792 RepID=W2QSB0_PHYN3|nr:hypothetical protein PPTG_06249 [Phytophthora nicotianae INRA-310]ETK71917.1 hypothetical protein L915_20912 [Phytophthora nicotianae]ETO60244.1 hypothetical protein F444_21528 [Phytophthora nicotianae P1976]ETP01345.1 hypothetical protein F441_21399 [Phytophthora nicotianae CJ01A1]ETL25348.1 hypothetical protein L916_20795 [Phytophthora nicotianae]ETL78571.1 hypothetical protein L917_20646 [Phytophthora nicotianae]
MQNLALIATGATVLASMPAVRGHGFIVEPAAQWFKGYPDNGWGSTVDNEIWGTYDFTKYGYGPNGTLGFFKDTFPTKGYDSLGQFIAKNQELYSSDIDPDCGWTIYKDSARSELPEAQLEYTGFTHPGPCEIWCDDTKLLFDYDCWTKYPAIPAKIPYDKSKCADANRLTIYWIGIHGVPWQIYTDCVWLKGGSGRGEPPSAVGPGASTVAAGSGSSSTPTPTSTSPATTAPSTATKDKPASKETASEASTAVDDAPAATTAPAKSTTEETTPVTTAPSTPATNAKCSRRG